MKSRTIGINTLFMIPHGVGGTEYHLRSFLKHLEQEDTQNFYVIFCNRENFPTFHFTNPKWKKVLCPIYASFRPSRICYEQLILPFLVAKYHCDILHSLGYFGPIFSPAKHIITVHDVNWRDCPEDFSLFERAALVFLIEANMKRCTKIMSVSEFTRKRLIHYFPSMRSKIHVIPSAISDDFVRFSNLPSKNPLGDKKYLLCVSGLYPHKRIPYVLNLWEYISKKNVHLRLALIGQNGRDEKFVQSRLKTLPRIHYFASVSLPTLVAYYAHAKALLFPSVYEGFGFPVYESLSVGCPVIAGKRSLYYRPMQRHIFELTFDVRKDVQLIGDVINKNLHVRYVMPTDYRQATRLLIDLYSRII